MIDYINIVNLIIKIKNHTNKISIMQKQLITILLAITGLISLAFINTDTSTTTDLQFQQWKSQYSIKYQSKFQEFYRRKIFAQNILQITIHNANKHNTYQIGINAFSALTKQEFVHQYLGNIIVSDKVISDSIDTAQVGDVDWRTQGAVTRVKDEGQCGSCWAFAATGSLEGLSKIAYGKLQSFSEQQLIDCSDKYGNYGCNGGFMDSSFKFVKDNGIATDTEYPYKGVQQNCKQATGAFKISGYTDLKTCNDLANAITSIPVAVAVDATNWASYKSGIFNNCQTAINHTGTLVGISDTFWLVKNLWGLAWGENGYIRLARGNTCGICNLASYPKK